MEERKPNAADMSLLADIVRHAPIRIFWKDREGRYLGCNTLFAHDAGSERPENIIGKTDFDMGWREQADLYRADDFAVMASGKAKLGYEEPQTTPDGSIIWLRTSKVPLHDEKGEVIGMLGIYEDITQHKNDEEALRDSEQKLSAILDNVDAYIYLKDEQGRYLFANRLVRDLWKAEMADIVGFGDEKFFDAPTTENIRKNDSRVLRYGETVRSEETNTVPLTGETHTYMSTKLPLLREDGSVYALCGISTDITRRIQSEKALQESEKRFRDMFEKSPDPCWIINQDNLFMMCNQAAADILGYASIEELTATHPSKLSPEVQPDGRDSFEKANDMMATAHEKGVHRFEWEHRRKNGECFPVEVTLAQIEFDGNPQLYCIWRDISERKQAELALSESEERLQMAQSIGLLGVWDWNPRTGKLLWTDETYQIFGYEPGRVEPTFEIFLEHVHPDDRGMVRDSVEAALLKGLKYDIDCRFRRCDGSEGVANAQGKVFFGDAGTPVRMLGTFQDITVRKQTEERLREALSVQQATLESTADGILVVNHDGQWTAFNRKFIEMWNITPEIMASKDDQRALNHVLDQLVDPQAFIDKVMSLYDAPEETSFDVLSFKDGRVFERYSMAQRVENETTGRVWSFRDVTDRHRAEEQLRRSEERLRLAMDAAGQGWIDLHVPSGRMIVSPGIPRMLGYTEQEYSPSLDTLRSTLHEDDAERVFAEIDRCIHETGHAYLEYRRRRKDGQWIWVGNSLEVVERDDEGRAVRMIGVHTDITARKETENNLLASEAALKEAQRISNTGSWHVDLATDEVFWSEELYRMFGFDPSAPPPPLSESAALFTPESWEQLDSMVTRVVEEGGNYELELEAIPRSGGRKWMLARGELVQDKEGKPVRLQGVVMDITERKRAEKELLQARFVMDNAPYNITFLDEHAKIQYLNKTARETFGLTEEEVGRGLTLKDIDPEVTPEIWQAHWEDLKKNKRVSLERTHQRKNGENFPVEIIANYVQFGEEAFNAAFDLDITERKMLESHMRESQKMEAIGTLVGGIAHDFNNMLAAIQGNVYLAEMQLQGHGEALEKVEDIRKLGERAAEMVRQLLTFARKDRVSMLVFSLNSFMKEGLKLTRTLIPENIDFNLDICEADLRIRGDATQLQQVLMNLLKNAVDAVEGVQQPTISCTLETFSSDTAFRSRYPMMASREFACLRVEDNGCGIPEEAIEKIFEPFFTSKEVGKGTGLGLAMIYGSVRTHGGVVEVDSSPGQGSSFRVYLPISAEQQAESSDHRIAAVRGEGQTILLVDDQKELLTTSAQVLKVLGYQVLEASSGRQALEVFRRHSDDIALVISDVVMPELGGVELLRAVRELSPGLPFIMVTGYDRHHVLDGKIDHYVCRVMEKPFNFNVLSIAIKEMLEAG